MALDGETIYGKLTSIPSLQPEYLSDSVESTFQC